MSAVCSLRYEALGKFREHSRVALGYASSNFYASFTLSKLPHASYLNECMLTYEPIVAKKEKNLFQFKNWKPYSQFVLFAVDGRMII